MNDTKPSPRGRFRNWKFVSIAAVVVALAATGTAFATSQDDDARDKPIPASALSEASAAALKSSGGGKVTETEVGDEESYYEVEVTRPDGSVVDVQLDRSFAVVGSKPDDDKSEPGGK